MAHRVVVSSSEKKQILIGASLNSQVTAHTQPSIRKAKGGGCSQSPGGARADAHPTGVKTRKSAPNQSRGLSTSKTLMFTSFSFPQGIPRNGEQISNLTTTHSHSPNPRPHPCRKLYVLLTSPASSKVLVTRARRGARESSSRGKQTPGTNFLCVET